MGQICSQPSSATQDSNKYQDALQISSNEPGPSWAKYIDTFPALVPAIQDKRAQLPPLKNFRQQKNSKVYQFSNGTIYQGIWKQGQMQGFGRLVLPDQSYLEGRFVKNNISGQGRIIHPEGDYYEGQFFESKANGQGKYVSKTMMYIGQFKDNLEHGKGQEQKKGYYIFEGNFHEGKKRRGKMTYLNKKEIYEGEFYDNQYNGQGRIIIGSEQYRGTFLNGSKHGVGRIRIGNGSFQTCYFIRGKLATPSKSSFVNNPLRQTT